MKKTKPGFTLIELVMSIVIAGIALYSLIFVFITVTTKNVSVEALTTAWYLASGKLEEVSSRSYNLITSESLASFGGDFNNFNRTVIISYVSSEALDTPVEANYGYKKVTVRVTSSSFPSSIEVQALVTDVSNE